MRKRAQRRNLPIVEEPKHILQRTKLEKEPSTIKKNWWIAITLIGIFLLVLFFNTYFNFTSGQTVNQDGEGLGKYYLSGPDPYYNMRLVDETVETGHYAFYSEKDPLLNYPVGKTGGRPPLLNMVAIGFSRFLTPFMSETDALGYSMQFVPALFGALLVFPVYFIGKTIFGRKTGLLAALFVSIIPIHLSSGHGSAYSLFDHDSFNLLLFFLAFLFLIKAIKEKEAVKSTLFAVLSGVSVAALSMTWVEARFLYVVIAIYAVVQMLIDIYTDKIELDIFRTTSVVLISGYLFSLPVDAARFGDFRLDIPFYLCLIVAVFGAVYYIFGRKRIPWTLSLPAVFCAGGIGIVFLYFIKEISSYVPFLSSLSKLSSILFGVGIYGSKVSLTIAEAHTYDISQTVMSFGPVLYWLAWAGFVFLAYHYYKSRQRREYLLIIILFAVYIWLTGTAGRFLNEMVPVIAILGGWIVFVVVDKIDYKQMVRNVRGAGGGIHGLRRGVKIIHILGILFIALLVVFPNAYLAFDAGVPYAKKTKIFGDLPSGAFGLPHPASKEAYWIDAYDWLNDQDLAIEDPVDRPGFISWWDYGFYESAIGEHPTVADNFQDGIPPAANFHTAASEEEAVAVWVVRLLEGNLEDNAGVISDEVKLVLEKHLGENDTINITSWIEDPTVSPSYNAPIGAGYDENLSKQYRVGEQWPENAVYHDVTELLTTRLDDEGITWLYHDIQEATGYSIRYYGVEGYDKQIFDIFGFLGDKSLLLVSGAPYAVYNGEDDFVQIKYVTQSGKELNFSQLKDLSDEDWATDPPVINQGVFNTKTHYKDLYFETMFYRAYVGVSEGASGSKYEPNYHLPCFNMRHFYAEYISDIYQYPSPYTGKAAVVIAKYYEGAYVNGSVTFNGEPVQAEVVVLKNISHYNMTIPLDHDTMDTTSSGGFNLIAPAGNITLQVRRILGDTEAVIKNVTFDEAGGSDYAPISEADAMRRSDNYERFLNVSVQPANISGYIFDDEDYDGVFNSSVDQPVNNIDVVVTEILSVKSQIDPTTGQTQQIIDKTGDTVRVANGEDGYYTLSDLLPGLYRLEFYDKDTYLLNIVDMELYEGNNSYNVKKPKLGNIEGKVFYDKNLDGGYDTGEEISGAEVKIYHYNQMTEEEELENETTTSSDGSYLFKGLFPGNINGRDLNKYIIKVNKLPYYTSELTVYPVENETIIENISIGLTTINVSGYTKYGGSPIGDITIDFEPDGSVDKNTAEASETISKGDGFYSLGLSPGYYNVSISEKEGSTLIYSFNGKLNLSVGQGSASYDIFMSKNSTTVIGTTSFEGIIKDNVSIKFEPVVSENNTAIKETAISDVNGVYRVELAPGKYNIFVNQTITEEGQDYTYSFEALNVDISFAESFDYDIVLSREAID